MKSIILALFLVSCASTTVTSQEYSVYCGGTTSECNSKMFSICGYRYQIVNQEALTLGSKKDPLALVTFTCR